MCTDLTIYYLNLGQCFMDYWCDNHCWSWCIAQRTEKKKWMQNAGIRTHSEEEGRKVKCWLKRGGNQSSEAAWLTACQGVFCGGVKNSTIALPRPSSLFLFPPLSLYLIHHLPLHPSSHCCLLVNVSPNSPSASLTVQSIVPPLPLSLVHPLIFLSGGSLIFLAKLYSLPAI